MDRRVELAGDELVGALYMVALEGCTCDPDVECWAVDCDEHGNAAGLHLMFEHEDGCRLLLAMRARDN